MEKVHIEFLNLTNLCIDTINIIIDYTAIIDYSKYGFTRMTYENLVYNFKNKPKDPIYKQYGYLDFYFKRDYNNYKLDKLLTELKRCYEHNNNRFFENCYIDARIKVHDELEYSFLSETIDEYHELQLKIKNLEKLLIDKDFMEHAKVFEIIHK